MIYVAEATQLQYQLSIPSLENEKNNWSMILVFYNHYCFTTKIHIINNPLLLHLYLL